jgi:hypothetical protein
MRKISVGIAVSVTAILWVHQAAAQPQPATSADDSVRAVIERFQAIRPDEKDLAVYGLDWAPTLTEAKDRAAQEHRPVLLIVVTNSFGNIYTGHC